MGEVRRVVLLCGPPGAGKTTAAHGSGLEVYDQDSPRWGTPKAFNQALADLRTDPTAQAVVIRSGATSSARRKAAALVGATHVYVIDPGQAACMSRVKARARADYRGEIQGVLRWYATHERRDHVRDFPGWHDLDPPSQPPPPPAPRATRTTPASRGYGAAHRAERKRWKPIVDAGHAVCARCGAPITPGDSWDLGHSDDRVSWTGPEHARCNRAAGGRNGQRVALERNQMVRRRWS